MLNVSFVDADLLPKQLGIVGRNGNPVMKLDGDSYRTKMNIGASQTHFSVIRKQKRGSAKSYLAGSEEGRREGKKPIPFNWKLIFSEGTPSTKITDLA